MAASQPRISFLVDGFNVYHSLRDARRDLGNGSVMWLDLRRLLSTFIPAIDAKGVLGEIFYFSALAYHFDSHDPGNTARHELYIKCLESTGIVPILGRFKRKDVRCTTCQKSTMHHEEKETDVAISAKLFELFHHSSCEIAVIVSGDTDLAPVIRTAQALYGTGSVCIVFPYRRKNNELSQLTKSFMIKMQRYQQHQFPLAVRLLDGTTATKPPHW